MSQSYLTFCNGRNKRRLLAALMFQANWGWGSAALAILFSLILCGGLAAAQPRDPQDGSTLSIEDLMKIKLPTVCGASKFEQKIIEAPSFITIITSDEIRKHGYRTFAEVLRRVPGFFVTDDRNYGYIATRGFMGPGSYYDRMLIEIDGHRLNENAYDGACVDTEFPVDLDPLFPRQEILA